jgi:hypothetical protein
LCQKEEKGKTEKEKGEQRKRNKKEKKEKKEKKKGRWKNGNERKDSDRQAVSKATLTEKEKTKFRETDGLTCCVREQGCGTRRVVFACALAPGG